MKVSVIIGSNKINVAIQKDTICQSLIKEVLTECKINTKTSTSGSPSIIEQYSLFERALGVERRVSHDENIFELWLQWSLHNKQRIEFIVRKSNVINKALVARTNIQANPSKVFKAYKLKYSDNQPLKHVTKNIYQDATITKVKAQLANELKVERFVAANKENTRVLSVQSKRNVNKRDSLVFGCVKKSNWDDEETHFLI